MRTTSLRHQGRLAQRVSRVQSDDGGFTLIEAVVALLVATLMFMGLAASATVSLRGTTTGRQNQQSIDAANQALEQIRSYSYDSVVMVTSDLFVNDSSAIIHGSSGSYTFDPGTGVQEPLVVGSVGSINPHVTTFTVNNTPYTVRRYVTAPTDSTGATYRRITVVVSWTTYGLTHTRSVSSLLVNTRRGLPLPRFVFTPIGAQKVTQGPGTVLSFGFTVQNLGARDGWNITASNGAWTFYADPNGDGVYEGSETTQLGDFDLNGVPDTGELEPNTLYHFIAVRTIGNAESGTTATTFTATSITQPSAPTASASITDTVVVTSGIVSSSPSPSPSVSPSPTGSPAPGPSVSPSPVSAPSCATHCTLVQYFFHNVASGTEGNSTTQPILAMDANSTTPGVFNFSTEQVGTAGRYLANGGTGVGETRPLYAADFRFSPASATTFAGEANVTVYVGCISGAGPVTLTAYVGSSGNATVLGGFTSYGSGAATLSNCSTTSFTPVTIAVPVASFVAGNNGNSNNNPLYAEVRVELGTASTDVRILYDAAGYQSGAVLPS